MFEVAYQMSQELRLQYESVEALIGKSNVIFMGDVNKGLTYVVEAERIVNDLIHDSSINVFKKEIIFIKSWISLFKGKLNKAEELPQESLKLFKLLVL